MATQDERIRGLPAGLREGLGGRVSLELELAGDPEPLVGERIDALAMRVDPGVEAFAIRNGERWAFAMPAVLQSRNQLPRLDLLSLGVAREAGLDPAASRDLRLPEGCAAYRVPTLRLTQRDPESASFESRRGSRLVPLESIDRDAVRGMARALTEHLVRRWPNADGLPPEGVAAIRAMGPRAAYQPASGSWPLPVSPPADQALAALAMARWSQLPGLEASERDAARDFACRTLKSLSEVTAEEIDPRSDVAAMACVLLAAKALDTPGTAPDAHDWADVPLRAWIDQLRDTLQSPGEGVTPATGAAAAMVCAALGPAAGESMTQRAWDPGQPERALQSTPWLVDRMPADAGTVWAEVLPRLLAAQCRLEGRGCPEELDGGWGGTASAPRPTAASAKLSLALASALADPACLRDADRAVAVEALRRSMRFLRQLQVDEDACHAFRDSMHARGGIRSAPWDSDQPMAASATALLACIAAEPWMPPTEHAP